MANCLNIVHFIYKRNPATKKDHKREYKIKNPILCYKPITRREGEEGGQEKKVKRRARVGKRDTQLSYCYRASVERRLGWSLNTQSESSIQNDVGCQFLLQLTYMSLLCSDVITHHVWSMIGRGPECGEVGKQWRQERGDHGYGQELSSGDEPVPYP